MFRAIQPSKLVLNIVSLFCIVAILQTLVVSIYFAFDAARTIEKNAQNFVKTYSQNVSSTVDAIALEMDRTAKIILGNSQIQQALIRRNSPYSTELQELRDYDLIENTIFSFTSLRSSTYIFLADKEENIILSPNGMWENSNRNIFDDKYISEMCEVFLNGDFLLVPPSSTSFKSYGNRPAVLYIRALNDLQSNDVISYIVIMFTEDFLENRIHLSLPSIDNIRITFLDKRGTTALSYPPKYISTQPVYTADFISPVTGFTCQIEIPQDYFQKNSQNENIYIVPIFLTIIAGAVFLSFYLYFRVLQPLSYLLYGMQKVEKGDLSVRISYRTNLSDTKSLLDGFNQMAVKLNKLTEAVVAEKVLFKDAQIAALQYQINPHFLYNTLQTLESIAEVKEVTEIQKIAKNLGDLLRYNIRGASMVKLEQELKYAETYFDIERIRFSESLTYLFDISPEAKSCMIPKFIIQPVVENCFVHGLRKKTGEKWVRIFAYIENHILYICIKNNGIPISKEKLNLINAKLRSIDQNESIDETKESIGLMNVQQRILHKYGHPYGVELSTEGVVTCVTIQMPEESK